MLSIEQYFEFKYQIFELQKEDIDTGCLETISYCVGLDFEDWDEDVEGQFMQYIYDMTDSEEEFIEEMMYRYSQVHEAEERKRERYMELLKKQYGKKGITTS